MADQFFCRECGETVIWSERKRRWTHENSADDHNVVLAKTSGPNATGEGVEQEPVFVDRSEMIGDPLEGLNNIGTTGTLDGEDDDLFSNERWVELRILIDQVWELTGGKPWIG